MPVPVPRPCVVFDFDGTLADSLDAIVLAINDTLVAHGRPPRSRAGILDHMGRGLRALYTWAAEEECPELLAPLIDGTRERYSQVWRENTRVFPRIPELLAGLRARGASISILSNKGHETTVEVAEGLFPAGTFDRIHGITEGWPGKPNPQGLLRIIEAVGSSPSHALMVGDMSVDIRVGRAASVRTVGVTWGFQGTSAFSEDAPDFIVERPEAILDLFEALKNG